MVLSRLRSGRSLLTMNTPLSATCAALAVCACIAAAMVRGVALFTCDAVSKLKSEIFLDLDNKRQRLFLRCSRQAIACSTNLFDRLLHQHCCYLLLLALASRGNRRARTKGFVSLYSCILLFPYWIFGILTGLQLPSASTERACDSAYTILCLESNIFFDLCTPE